MKEHPPLFGTRVCTVNSQMYEPSTLQTNKRTKHFRWAFPYPHVAIKTYHYLAGLIWGSCSFTLLRQNKQDQGNLQRLKGASA